MRNPMQISKHPLEHRGIESSEASNIQNMSSSTSSTTRRTAFQLPRREYDTTMEPPVTMPPKPLQDLPGALPIHSKV